MEIKNLNELLQHTCDQVEFLSNVDKCTYEDVVLAMFKGVKKDFEERLKLLMLTSDYALEYKQLKYILRKSKRLRKKSWKLTFKHIAKDYRENKLDMYSFDYDKIEERVKEYKLFDKNQKPICVRRKPAHKGRFLIFRRRKLRNESNK